MEQKTTIPLAEDVKKLEEEVLNLYETISKVPIVEETRFRIPNEYETLSYSGGHFVPNITQKDINELYREIIKEMLRREAPEEAKALNIAIRLMGESLLEGTIDNFAKKLPKSKLKEEQLNLLRNLKAHAEQDLRYKATLLSPDSKVYVVERRGPVPLSIMQRETDEIVLKGKEVKSAILAYKL